MQALTKDYLISIRLPKQIIVIFPEIQPITNHKVHKKPATKKTQIKQEIEDIRLMNFSQLFCCSVQGGN